MTTIILRGPARVLEWIVKRPTVMVAQIERQFDISNTQARDHLRTLVAMRLVEVVQDPCGKIPAIYAAANPMPMYEVTGRMKTPKRPKAAEQLRAKRAKELEQVEREIEKPFRHILREDWTLDHRIGVRSVFELAHR